MKNLLALLVPLVLLSNSAEAQRPADEFGEVVEVVEVEVPVHVVRDGTPVRGLTAENFEVFDGRKKVALSGFAVVDLGDPETSETMVGLPAVARRHFLLLFDLSFSDPSSLARSRSAAQRMVDEALHPSDLVGVATYSIRTGAQIILSFTSDREQAKVAIDSLGLPQLIETQRDPLGIVLTAAGLTDEGGIQNPSSGGGRPSVQDITGPILRDTLEDLSVMNQRNNRAAVQQNALAFAGSFTELAQMLQGVDGRKHLILLSQGFDSQVLLGTQDIEAQQRMNRASETGEVWNIDSDERFGNTAALSVVDRMVQELRKSDVVVQAVDVGGLSADGSGRSKSEDSLFIMADSTGGELLRNFNDPGAAMGEVLDRTSVTYLLRFQPDKLKNDGSYRKLRVKLKNAARGTRVVHRPGYFEPKPFAQRTALERRFNAASEILAGTDSGAIRSSVLATPFPVAGDSAYVPVFVEIDGGSLLAGHRGNAINLEIYTYAIAEDGGVRDYFSHSMGLDLTKIGATLESHGIKFYGHLDLWPGDYSVRVLVRDSASGRSSTRVVPVAVPTFDQAEAGVSVPLFPEPLGKWLMVREGEAQQAERTVPYPFMVGEDPYIPAAKPVISPNGNSSFFLIAYNVADDAVAEARVRSADGSPVSSPSIAVNRQDAGDGVANLTASLNATGLPEGEYVLEVEVSSDAAGSLTNSIAFEVASKG